MSIIIEETHSSAPIGVFDSGVGGLTVAREIMRNLPDERIVYFGDTARSAIWKQVAGDGHPIFETNRPLFADTARKSDRDRLQHGECTGVGCDRGGA